jgi:hypothetical protein
MVYNILLTRKGDFVMKLKSAEQEKETRSRRGRTSKAKGSNFERAAAKKFRDGYDTDFVRTPLSGGFHRKDVKSNQFRGDIVPANEDTDCILHIEVKCRKTWKLNEWLRQAQNDCPAGKYPVVVFHQHGTSKDYITMDLNDFIKLIPKENIIQLKEVIVS